jgi:hypothetical protein
MSDSPPRRRTLESLKKEAKRWLDDLRQNQPESRIRFERVLSCPPAKPGLRDVQHALALEHGFSGWTELKRKLMAEAEETVKALGKFEEMADALLEAYRTGTAEAMERHWALTWHRRNHQALRTYVQLDLGRLAGSKNQNDDISLDDARLLVAREHGFDSWHAVVQYYRRLVVSPSRITAKPIRLLATEMADEESPGWESREWDAVLSHLKESSLVGIDAAGQMTDDMLEDLASLANVQVLRLGGSRSVTDAGMHSLASLSGLRHLDLRGTSVTDRGLEALRSLPGLETISLAWTKVTDGGAAHLAGCSQLVGVNLQGTSTGDGWLRALAGKSRLRQLRSGNAVTDAGLAGLREIPVFKSWQGGEPKMGLLSYDAGPNYLLLRGTFTDRGMAQLEDLAGLFALNLDASELQITAEGLARLVALPNLGWLAIDATDDSMPYVARMSRLRFLGCQDTVATDKGFMALSQSQSIEYIWGRRCHNLQTEGFAALARMPALRGLSVSCKHVVDSGVAALPRFPALRELMPMDIPDEGYRHIALCAGLESLILMYCRETGDAATEHLVRLPRLRNYFASYTQITDRTPELLSRMDSLESITLSDCVGVTDIGLAHLARLPRLRALRVSGPHITDAITRAFPTRVRVHRSP